MEKFLKIFLTVIVYGVTLVALFLLNSYFSNHMPLCFEFYLFPQLAIVLIAALLSICIWFSEFCSDEEDHSATDTTN